MITDLVSLTDCEVVLSLELHVLLPLVVNCESGITYDLLNLSDLMLFTHQLALLRVNAL